MSFISAEQQDNVGLPLELGRPTLFSHVRTAVDTTLYDLPMQNIERAIELQHAGQEFSEISAEEANTQYGITDAAGNKHVEFDKPISWKKAELINKYKREELERFQELDMGNDTLFRKSAFFVSGFAAQGLDPINLAAMFVPVVGEAKFANLVLKHGLTKARLIAGATEAAVGMAVVEPMSYLSKAVGEQNIYGIRDTIANVTAGTFLGTGIRVAGGRLKDTFFGKYNAKEMLATIDAKNPKARLNDIELGIVSEAKASAKRAGLKKDTPAWKAHVLHQIEFGERMNEGEIRILEAELRSLSSVSHRKAFEEAINNIANDEPISTPNIMLQIDRMNDIRTVMKKASQTQVPDKKITQTGTTEISVGKAKVEVASAGGTTHIKIIEAGKKPEDLQGIIYRQAKIALETGQELHIDDVKMDQEALDVFVNGPEVAAKTPPTPDKAPKFENPKATSDHVDTSTAEARSDATLATAEEINKAAAEIELKVVKVSEAAEATTKAVDDAEAADIVTQAYETQLKELEDLLDEYNLPDDVRDQIMDDFTAPERLADEQSGIETAVDCVLRNLI